MRLRGTFAQYRGIAHDGTSSARPTLTGWHNKRTDLGHEPHRYRSRAIFLLENAGSHESAGALEVRNLVIMILGASYYDIQLPFHLFEL